jgi:hypothetical protein
MKNLFSHKIVLLFATSIALTNWVSPALTDQIKTISKTSPKVSPARAVAVIDEKNRPVAGAQVVLYQAIASPYADMTLREKGVTDASGRFRFSQKASDEKRMRWIGAWSQGKTLGCVWLSPSTSSAKLRLRPVQAVRVRMVDAKGQPLANVNARLNVRMSANRRATSVGEYSSVPADVTLPFPPSVTQAVSDAKGWLLLKCAAAQENAILSLDKPGLQTTMLRLRVPQEDNLAVRMVPGAQLRGVIRRNDNGAPLRGVRVSFSQYTQTTQLDAQGRFALTGADEMQEYLHLKSPDWVLPLKMVRTQRGKSLDLGTLKAVRGCVIRGKVSDALRGNSSNELYAQIAGNVSHRSSAVRWTKSATLDAKGNYEMRLPPGKFVLRYVNYSARGAASQPVVKNVTATDGATLRLDFDLNPRNAQGTPRVVRNSRQPRTPRLAYDTVVGKVVQRADGAAIADAKITIYSGDAILSSTRSNQRGVFVVGSLPEKDVPHRYLLLAQKEGFASAMALADPYSEQEIAFSLVKGSSLPVHVVTSDGMPVPDATVSVQGLMLTNSGSEYSQSFSVPSGVMSAIGPVTTDAKGEATISNLPSDVFVELKAEHAQFADVVQLVALPHPQPAQITISRETIIRGRVLLDGNPLYAPGMRIKTQGFGTVYGQFRNWHTTPLRDDGTFEIRKIPSLEVMGESSLCINLDFNSSNGPTTLRPGLTAEYVPRTRGGWDTLIAEQKNGQTRYWLAHVRAWKTGLVYQEGENLQVDFHLKPMALLKGQVPRGTHSISYTDPDSRYGQWNIRPDASGKFELPVPVGDVSLRFSGSLQTIKNLKPHEIRTVDFKGSNASSRHTRQILHPFQVRVLGPDGVTVPRPLLTWKLIGGPRESPSRGVGEMDGSFEVYLWEPCEAVEFQSPFMDKPVRFSKAQIEGEQPLRLRYNRIPSKIPGRAELDAFFMRQSTSVGRQPSQQRKSPTKVNIGEAAPPLEVDKWSKGGPVNWNQLRGKIVVVAFGQGSERVLKQLQKRFPDVPLAAILIRSAHDEYSGDANTASDPIWAAIGRDFRVQNDWVGYNAKRFATSSGSAIIDPEGRVVATGLSGDFLMARLEQMLSNSAPQ